MGGAGGVNIFAISHAQLCRNKLKCLLTENGVGNSYIVVLFGAGNMCIMCNGGKTTFAPPLLILPRYDGIELAQSTKRNSVLNFPERPHPGLDKSRSYNIPRS
mgnify:FL=1